MVRTLDYFEAQTNIFQKTFSLQVLPGNANSGAFFFSSMFSKTPHLTAKFSQASSVIISCAA